MVTVSNIDYLFIIAVPQNDRWRTGAGAELTGDGSVSVTRLSCSGNLRVENKDEKPVAGARVCKPVVKLFVILKIIKFKKIT